jgi:hypothetical protein
MARPQNLTMQNPGAGAPTNPPVKTDSDAFDAAAQMGSEPGTDGDGDAPDAAEKDAQIAALKAQLAELTAASKLPQVVTEPVTPHGAIALAQSAFAGMTVAELMAGIDAGKYREPPVTSVLCADGWYARRGMSV